MRVFVYWNLHRSCWSIKALQGPQRGRVIGHARDVELASCEFRVSEAGRQRVLREGRKNVHAGIVGTLCIWHEHGGGSASLMHPCEGPGAARRWEVEQITYNPYRAPTFVSVDGPARPVRRAERVVMRGREVLAVRPTA